MRFCPSCRNVARSLGFLTRRTRVFGSRQSCHVSALGIVLSMVGLQGLAGSLPAHADPLGVTYAVANLGGGSFEYTYTLSGYDLLAGDDLAIYFSLATSANLIDLGTGGADYTTFVFQPDPAIPADGEFDAVANVDNPSLQTIFGATFLYSGTGTPGAQSFTLYDPNFNVISTGETVAATPEPSSVFLLCSGLVATYTLRRRQRLQA